MIALIVAAAAAQAADLVTFGAAVARHGPIGEANPAVRAVYTLAGLPGVALMKAATLLIVLLVAYALAGAGAPRWVTVAVLSVATVAGALGAGTNLWALTR